MFNVKQYLDDNNIQYKTEGKNCSIGFINICCIFCNDSGFHLGISEKGTHGSCWRCKSHSIYDIIKKLNPNDNPNEILKQYDTSFISTKIKEKLKYNNTSIKVPGDKLANIHKQYLKSRGFDPDYLENKYKLKGTLTHPKFNFRLVIPIYYNNKVVTYQTRGLTKDDSYINCVPELEIIPIKDILYNLNNCKKDYIVVVEGVMKVFRLGDNSACTFSKNFSNKQLQLLSKYKRVFVYFDNDDPGKQGSIKLTSMLDSIGVECYKIDNNKPPDELTELEALKIMKEIENFC